MRVIVFIRATKNSEAGVMPSEKLLTAMGTYNEELVAAGILVSGEGLKPSAAGKRITFGAGDRKVIDGPFETGGLTAGFWIWNVSSMDEAVSWAKRCPEPMPGEETQLEIRPLFEMEDFGDEMTPELRAQEEQLRAKLETKEAPSS